MATETAVRVAGRPRSPRADRAILAATARLLREQGYDAMSIEGVAAAAGVGKTTIYRRFPSKRELVLAALSSLAATADPPSDTGDARADLAAFLGDAFRLFFGPDAPGFSMAGTLLVHEREDPELLAMFRARIIEPRIALATTILERGVERGQLRPDVPREAVIKLIAGSVFAQHIAGGEFDDAWVDAVLDVIWDGIAAPPAGTAPG